MNKATLSFVTRIAPGKIAMALLAGWVVVSIPLQGAGQDAGQVKFVNSCKYSLTLNSTGPQLGTLAAGGQKSVPIPSFNQGGQNRIIAYPNLSDNQCPNCDGWTRLGRRSRNQAARRLDVGRQRREICGLLQPESQWPRHMRAAA